MKLQTTLRERLILVAVILIGALLWFGHVKKINILEKAQKRAIDVATGRVKAEMKTYVDENGKLHSKVEQLEVDRDAYIRANEPKLDSIADELNIRKKQIKSLTNLITEIKGSISTKVDTEYVDTGRTKPILTVRYKDAWMTLNGQMYGGFFNATYSIKDSLQYVTYQKNGGFLGLGKKKTFLDVKSANPNMKITNMSSVELTKVKDKRWSIGPYIGYGYNGVKFTPSIGIGLQYGLIRF